MISSAADPGAADAGMGDMPGAPGGMSGGMGDMSGGPGGMPGGPGGAEAAESNCTHEQERSIVDLTWKADDPAVAELVLSGHETLVHGLKAGETTIYMTVTCNDGTERTAAVEITVAPAPVAEEPESSIENTATPEESVPAETSEPAASNAGEIVGMLAILLVGCAVVVAIIRKKRR